jgi:hypothetical protein
MSTPQVLQFTFGMNGCRCTNFALTEFGKSNINAIPFEKYQYDVAIRLDIRKENDLVSVLIKSSLTATMEPTVVIAEIETANDYKVLNLDQIITETNVNMMLPEAIVQQLFIISMSNLRGMFAVKLENTIYNNAVLPVMDINQLIPKKNPAFG